MLKEKLKVTITKKAVYVALAIVIIICSIYSAVLYANSRVKVQNTSAAYLSANQAQELTDYIKVQAYDVIDTYSYDYVYSTLLSDYLTESDLSETYDYIVDFMDITDSSTADKIKSKLNEISVDLYCNTYLNEESKNFIAEKITVDLADYIAQLDINNIDNDELNEQIGDSTVRVLNSYKNSLVFDAEITNTDANIFAQVIDKLITAGLIDSSSAQQLINSISSDITLDRKSTMELSGSDLLTDEVIAQMASMMTNKISASINNGISSYNQMILSINSQISSLSKEYLDSQNQITTLNMQISQLSTLESNNATNITENVKNIEELKTQVASITNQNAEVSTKLLQLDAQKENISILQSTVSSLSTDMNTSIEQLKDSLSEKISNLANNIDQNDSDYSDELNKLQELCDSLDDDKVSMGDFDAYVDDVNSLMDKMSNGNAADFADITKQLKAIQALVSDYNNTYMAIIYGNADSFNSSLTGLKDSLQVTIDELSADNNEANAQTLTKLQSIYSDLDTGKVDATTFSSTKSELQSLISTLNIDTTASLNSLNSNINTVTTDLNTLNNSLSAQINSNVDEISDLKKLVNGNTDAFNASMATVKSNLQSTIDELSKDTSKTNAETLTKLQGVYDELSTGKVDATTFSSTKSELEGLISTLDSSTTSTINGLNTSLTNVNANITSINNSLTTSINTNSTDISALKSQITSLNSDLVSLKKSVSDGKSSIASTITSSGVTTGSDATWDMLCTNISKIKSDAYDKGYSDGYNGKVDSIENLYLSGNNITTTIDLTYYKTLSYTVTVEWYTDYSDDSEWNGFYNVSIDGNNVSSVGCWDPETFSRTIDLSGYTGTHTIKASGYMIHNVSLNILK